MITLHNIRAIDSDGQRTRYEVDLEWSGERAWYVFIDDAGDAPHYIRVVSSAPEGGLPLAFYRAHDWASSEICKLIVAVARGEAPSFPVRLAREAS